MASPTSVLSVCARGLPRQPASRMERVHTVLTERGEDTENNPKLWRFSVASPTSVHSVCARGLPRQPASRMERVHTELTEPGEDTENYQSFGRSLCPHPPRRSPCSRVPRSRPNGGPGGASGPPAGTSSERGGRLTFMAAPESLSGAAGFRVNPRDSSAQFPILHSCLQVP